MTQIPGVKYSDSFKRFQLTSYMVKYSLEPLHQLYHLKTIAIDYLEKNPDNETAQGRFLALQRVIEKKESENLVENVKAALL